MFKYLWVERGMLSGLTKKTCILTIATNNEPILSSMPAAGIVQDTFSGETGDYFYHPGLKFFPFHSN